MADRSLSARRALAQPDDIELARGIGMVGAVDLENAYDVVIVGAGPAGLPTAVYAGSEGLSVLVWVIVRGTGLKASMSRYLIDRITALPNVELLTETRITALEGKEGLLEAVGWTDAAGTETRRAVRNFFLFIGAQPNTDWLAGSGIALDRKGFVSTRQDAGPGARMLETSRHGVFAVADVRAGSIKRVAAAAGEGAQVVAAIHAHLAPGA